MAQDSIKTSRIRNFFRYNSWVVVLDIIAFSLSYLLALYIRFSTGGVLKLGERYINNFWQFIPFCVGASLVVFAIFRLIVSMKRLGEINKNPTRQTFKTVHIKQENPLLVAA